MFSQNFVYYNHVYLKKLISPPKDSLAVRRVTLRKCNLLNTDKQPKVVISNEAKKYFLATKKAFVHHDGFTLSKNYIVKKAMPRMTSY